MSMFDIKVFNPIIGGHETVATLTESDEQTALKKAEEFLFSVGVKHGELLREGAERSTTVHGYKDRGSIAEKDGGFGFRPNSPIYFLFKYFRENLGLRVDSFIDLGCGPGNILLSAAHLFGSTRLTGVEIDPGLVQEAKDNTRMLDAKIIEADLFTWVPEVNDYDLVYLYEPVEDIERRLRFLGHLKTWLNDGQYVFYTYAVGDLPEWLKPVEIPNYDYPCLFTFDKT